MIQTRYSVVERAALSFTGNTLGLIGTFYPSQSRITYQADGIGTFITNDTLLQSPGGYPVGTTQDYTKNQSTAYLSMLPNSEVLYAELTWGGSYTNALQDKSATINDSIVFSTPIGTFNIFPDTTVNQIALVTGTAINVYKRGAIVTSIVKNSGVGFYTVGNVTGALGPTYAPPTLDFIESNFLGWTLTVAYKNKSLPYRNLTTWSLLETIGINPIVDVTITNFSTPTVGTVSGRLLIAVGSGDSYIGGDTLRFGPNTSNLTALVGPNNDVGNFFSSQINEGDSENINVGLLKTSGTFGNNNQPIGTKSLNGRQGFDITNVDVSQTLTYNQSAAVIRLNSTGDYYYPLALGLQLDVNSANLAPIVKSVDKNFADVGDVITYTITFKNKGLVDAENVVLVDTITDSTTFITNSLYVNGVQQVGKNPYYPGAALDTIPPGNMVTVTFKVTVDTIPVQNPIINNVGVGYGFISAPSLPEYFVFDEGNSVWTKINNANLNISKTRDKAYAQVGEEITYSFYMQNLGNTIANTIIFKDTIPKETAYVPGSLEINNILTSGSPVSGVTIPNIDVGGGTTITFKVVVVSVPNANPIENEGTLKYSYVVDPSIPVSNTKEIISNKVYTEIKSIDLSNIRKMVDKIYTTCGDTMTYTIEIPNNGNVVGKNVIFYDTLDNALIFIPNSVMINNVNAPFENPTRGINLGNINPGEIKTIQFKVIVKC